VSLVRVTFFGMVTALGVTACVSSTPTLQGALLAEHKAHAQWLTANWAKHWSERALFYEGHAARWSTKTAFALRSHPGHATEPAGTRVYGQLLAGRLAACEVWGSLALLLALAAWVDGRAARTRALLCTPAREPSLPLYQFSIQLAKAAMLMVFGMLLMPWHVPAWACLALALTLVMLAWLIARHHPWLR
jgi:hypothetical protein